MLRFKKSKKSSIKNNVLSNNNLNFNLIKIQPKTENQQKVFNEYEQNKNLILYGSPGAGKTFLSLYLALKEVLNTGNYTKIVLFRSAVSGRDIGFLPGTEKEKLAVYESPYRSIVNDLFNRDDAYDILKHKGFINFESTSFLRGLTYNDCIMIVDESQNISYQELTTLYTRVGDNTKLLICGDIKQCDFNTKKESSGMPNIISISKRMESFSLIEFTIDDVCRSGFVKDFLIAKEELGL